MPTLEVLAAFALTSFILIIVPGPAVLFVVGRSLTGGRRYGLLSVAGNEAGALLLVAAVAVGVGSVIAASNLLFTLLKVVGGLYLVFLGVRSIRHRRTDETGTLDETPVNAKPLAAFRQGFVVGATNPKTIVFFTAIVPQFVSRDAGQVPLQIVCLGLIFVVIAFLSDGTWVLLASATRARITASPDGLPRARAAGGAAMIGLGILLLGARSPEASV